MLRIVAFSCTVLYTETDNNSCIDKEIHVFHKLLHPASTMSSHVTCLLFTKRQMSAVDDEHKIFWCFGLWLESAWPFCKTTIFRGLSSN